MDQFKNKLELRRNQYIQRQVRRNKNEAQRKKGMEEEKDRIE